MYRCMPYNMDMWTPVCIIWLQKRQVVAGWGRLGGFYNKNGILKERERERGGGGGFKERNK